MKNTRSFVYLVALVGLVQAYNPCNLRTTDSGSICVCSSIYCDTVPSLENLASKQYQLYSTSKEKLGFRSTTGTFANNNYSDPVDVTVTIDDITKTHQNIIGFGGAFTDATGINIAALSEGVQELFLESYFGEDGIQYSVGRIPIAATDFSIEGYTYLDEKDETLESFALREEDFNYKIPFVQKAIDLRGPNGLKLFASAWSAPIWMKTNDASSNAIPVYADVLTEIPDDMEYVEMILNDSEVVQYADGVGVHWYADPYIPASFLELASSDEKDLFRLATEGCAGAMSRFGLEKAVDLGSWQRADNYLKSIFDDMIYDVAGWIDWDMALNETGGPNWINNDVDSPVIVNATANEFYKQPMFYALGHFSKFIVPDSVRIDSDTLGDVDVSALAFVRPDGKIAVVLWNRSDGAKSVNINILGSSVVLSLDAYSINTLLYVL